MKMAPEYIKCAYQIMTPKLAKDVTANTGIILINVVDTVDSTVCEREIV